MKYNVKIILDGNVVATVPISASSAFEAEHIIAKRAVLHAVAIKESSDDNQ